MLINFYRDLKWVLVRLLTSVFHLEELSLIFFVNDLVLIVRVNYQGGGKEQYGAIYWLKSDENERLN